MDKPQAPYAYHVSIGSRGLMLAASRVGPAFFFCVTSLNRTPESVIKALPSSFTAQLPHAGESKPFSLRVLATKLQ